MYRIAGWIGRGAAAVAALLFCGSVASATTIGPDGAGYSASDTVAFSWEEISGTGTRIFAVTDDNVQAIPVGFTFQFYGTNYNTIYVTSNGTITFGAGNYAYAPHDNLTTNPAPTQQAPFNIPMIALLWTDLYTGGAGSDALYYQTLGSPGSRRLVIEWRNIAQCCSATPAGHVTFQVILYEGSNNLLFQYLDVTTPEGINNGGNTTIGIRDVDGHVNNRRLQWAFNQTILTDNKAILYTAPACANPGCSVCGNGTLQAGEQCDDGNDRGDDGCSVACKLEACSGALISGIDFNGDAGNKGIGLAVPSDGRPVMSYTDLTAQSLKLARCANASCNFGATIVTVDSSPNVGQCSSVVIGSDGFPFIVYRDFTVGAEKLKAAHCTNADCTGTVDLRILDNSDNVGCASSLTVGGDGFPLVSYYAATGGMRTVHCNDVSCSSFSSASVDAVNTGRNSAITRGSDSLGLISNTDNTVGSLRVAHCSDASCSSISSSTLEGSGVVDTDTAIAIGSDNLGVISYRNAAGLRLAHCNNTNCTSAGLTTVDGTANRGSYSSVAISGGLPYISYYDSAKGDLFLARCNDAACSSSSPQVIDASSSNRGSFSTLAVSNTGKRYIAFYDSTSTGVVIAACGQCGDGIVQGGEQCDGGASNGSSTSCCTSTCTYRAGGQPCRPSVGECDVAEVCSGSSATCPGNGFIPNGTVCTNDGNVCTNDQCSGGNCVHPNNSAPCSDGLFCNGNDQCSGGGCNFHFGNPCSGGAPCNDSCNEAADNCFNLVGTLCPDEGNVCTDNLCDGNGTCAHPDNSDPCSSDGNECTDDVCSGGACTHPNNSAPCTDGLYCTGADTCSGGSCATHSGDPCSGGADCQNICNESVDNCISPASTPCSTDGSVCTEDGCDGFGNCEHLDTPAMTCLDASKATVGLKQKPGDDAKDGLTFSWSGGPGLSQSSLGDPVNGDDYSLCVYDANGLVMESTIAGGTMCGDDPCWKPNRTVGYKYRDRTGTSDGITGLMYKAGDVGKSKLSVRGKGLNLPDPVLGLDAPVIVQLRRTDDGICFGATFDSTELKKNDSEQFRARNQ